jgi:hypothetical protein
MSLPSVSFSRSNYELASAPKSVLPDANELLLPLVFFELNTLFGMSNPIAEFKECLMLFKLGDSISYD